MSALIDLTGQRFERLTVISRASDQAGRTRWTCTCDCGKQKAVLAVHLRRGLIRSCGCLRRETSREINITDGKSHTPEGMAWRNMVSRCSNPRDMSYKNYGGRGIRVEFASFEEFLAEVGPKPPGTSIDRIDNDGNYAPGNVRWATRSQQDHNKRHGTGEKILKADDVRAIRAAFSQIHRECTEALAERYGVSPFSIYNVLARRNWKHIT